MGYGYKLSAPMTDYWGSIAYMLTHDMHAVDMVENVYYDCLVWMDNNVTAHRVAKHTANR